MNQEQQTTEAGKTKLVGEFYYLLARLQTQAINYVACGETDADKLRRVQDIIKLVKKTGAEIPDEDGSGVPHHGPEHCEPPCYVDRGTGMCMCDGGVLNPD
jgi:hypothetical protein